MKIAINTRLLIKNKLDGIGWFTYESLLRITRWHPEHEFIFIFDRPYSTEFVFAKNVTPVVLWPQARHPFLYYYYFEFAVKKYLKKNKINFFVSPDGYLSLKSKVPSLAVIHDINFIHRPKDLPLLERLYYTYFFKRYAHKAIRIATVSEFSKNDIAASYDIDPDKIDVVYNGANTLYTPLNDHIKSKIKNKYTKGCDYFIFIGTLHPRKNVHSLIKAFDEYKIQTGSDFKLVIVGDKMFLTGEMEHAYKNAENKDDIIFTGRLVPDELHELLGAAWALTFVPFFEGFGIPVLEAMNCDVPVIASNVTSIPEVAGKAALYVNPSSIQTIKEALVTITTDIYLRQQLIENARIQRTRFHWNKTAENLWRSIEKAIAQAKL